MMAFCCRCVANADPGAGREYLAWRASGTNCARARMLSIMTVLGLPIREQGEEEEAMEGDIKLAEVEVEEEEEEEGAEAGERRAEAEREEDAVCRANREGGKGALKGTCRYLHSGMPHKHKQGNTFRRQVAACQMIFPRIDRSCAGLSCWLSTRAERRPSPDTCTTLRSPTSWCVTPELWIGQPFRTFGSRQQSPMRVFFKMRACALAWRFPKSVSATWGYCAFM